MKTLHVGLLGVGATMAGALAFWMTQRPLIPDPPPLPHPVSPTASVAVTPSRTKPSPLNAPPEKSVAITGAATVESAPAPVYEEPAAKPALARKPKALVVATVAKPAPKLIAKVTPPPAPAKVPPTQWVPTQYQAPTAPAKPEAASASPASEPAPALTADETPGPAPAAPRHVTLQAGMSVAVRLSETLSSSGASPGDVFQATLAEPLVVDGLVIAERGARATGRVVDSERGVLSLALSAVFTSDGQRVAVLTDPWTRQSGQDDSFFSVIFRRPASAATGTTIHFRLSNRVTVTEQIAAR